MATRWVKNPVRVPAFSQEHDPVGRNPGGRHVIGGEPSMSDRIEQTGTYEDAEGGRFFFREGHPVGDAADYKLVEGGVPMTDAEQARNARQKAREERVKAEQRTDTHPNDAADARALPAAPQNRMEPMPANRARREAR